MSATGTPQDNCSVGMGSGATHAGDLIDILLATYNGAAHLEEQLESIAAQTHKRWRLIVRDDGSTDQTPQIIEAFRARYPEQVVVLRDNDGNLGLVGNFSRLMEHSTAPYVAFCDQDDVWIPEKLALTRAKMAEMERGHGAAVPLLVFTDLTVVDEDLQVIDPSYWRYQGVKPERCNALSRALAQNVVTGCTTLMNRALVRMSLPIPAEAEVHDWWLALVVAVFGVADYTKVPTVLYRQHRENIRGAKPVRATTALRWLPEIQAEYPAYKRRTSKRFAQADAFGRRYGKTLDAATLKLLTEFGRLPKVNILTRTSIARRHEVFPFGLLRAMIFIVFCQS